VMVDEVFELKELPRTDLGKIQKYKLKEALRVLKSGEA
jgi:acyl-coenzyme A synthetase/AMP-(fatty) acid ligase